jgi:hypothetical protein
MADLLPVIIDIIQSVIIEIVLPLLGTAVAGAIGWAAMNAAKVFGEQRAAALKAKIVEALINGLTKSAGVNTPGTPSFDQAITAGVAYAKQAYPQATAPVAEVALKTMAAKELNTLIEEKVAAVKPEIRA